MTVCAGKTVCEGGAATGWIPAFAGMTVQAGMTVGESGNPVGKCLCRVTRVVLV